MWGKMAFVLGLRRFGTINIHRIAIWSVCFDNPFRANRGKLPIDTAPSFFFFFSLSTLQFVALFILLGFTFEPSFEYPKYSLQDAPIFPELPPYAFLQVNTKAPRAKLQPYGAGFITR